MEKAQPRRLRGEEALFLYGEKPHEPFHTGACHVYEGSLTRDDLLHVVRERIHLLPRARQKILLAPLMLAHPAWQDDPDFSVEHQVEECTFSSSSSVWEIATIVGRFASSMLDRQQPLWKLVLFHGHPDGHTRLLSIFHQAICESFSGIAAMLPLHDLKKVIPYSFDEGSSWQPHPLPGFLTQLQHAVCDRFNDSLTWWFDQVGQLCHPIALPQRAFRHISAVSTVLSALLQRVPRTPFNGPLSGNRHLTWVAFPFADVRAVRSVLGGAVYELILTVIAGGLRQYLQHHAYPTDDFELRALWPIHHHRSDSYKTHNQRTFPMLTPLYVNVADPVQRFAAQRAAMTYLRKSDHGRGLSELASFFACLPPLWQSLASQLSAPNVFFNTIITNLAGPQIPLYLGGRRLLALHPVGPLVRHVGLFHGVVTYNQQLGIGITADAQLMPDVEFYLDCLKESFAELQKAADRVSNQTLTRTRQLREARFTSPSSHTRTNHASTNRSGA